MSALTEDRGTLKKIARLRTLEASGPIHAGALVAVNGSGKAVTASDAANLKVIGCAQHAAAEGENVTVEEGCFAFDGSGISNADIGRTVYLGDDHTVSLAAGTNGIVAGVVYDVDAEGVWIVVGRAPVNAAPSSAIANVSTAGTDSANIISALNSLLAAARSHGIISAT